MVSVLEWAARGASATTSAATRMVGYKYQQPSAILTTFQAGHGWTTSGAVQSTDLNATDLCIKGTQSAKVVTNGSAFLKRIGMPAFSLTGKALRFVMHMTNRAGLSNIIVRIGTGNLANAYRFRANPRNTATQSIGVENEWFTFTLGWADVYDAQGAGAYTLTNGIPNVTDGFTDIEINLSNGAGGPVTFHVQSVEVVDAPLARYPNGVVTLSFDDGWGSQEILFPAMDKYGYRGTQYVIAENVDATGRLPLRTYKNLQTKGWEIGGHSYTQAAHDARFIERTAVEIDRECRDLRRWLFDNGFDGSTFAYPGGEFDVTTDGVLVGDIVAQYFTAGRSILFSTGVNGPFISDAVLPPAMPWRVHAISGVAENKPTTSADSPTYITAAGGVLDRVKNARAWLNLTFHEGMTGVSSNGLFVGLAAFQSIMDGIASRGMACLPMSEVLADYQR